MQLNHIKGKFTLEKVPMTYDELSELVPLVATIARYDLDFHQNLYRTISYKLIDGHLYGRYEQLGTSPITEAWYFYDDSVCRWSECEKPEGA